MNESIADSVGAPGRGAIDQTIEYKTSKLTRFGTALAASALEHGIMYLMVGRDDAGTIKLAGSSTHHTMRHIEEILTVIDKLEEDTLSFTSTEYEYGLMRLGRLARRLYVGYNLDVKLSQSELTTQFGATWDEYFQEIWWALGSDLSNMFGKWSRLTNRRIDDMMVGLLITARHLSEDVSLWYTSQGDVINRAVNWQSGDHMGEYVPFNRKKRSTWDSVLFEVPVLGLDPDLVNDPDVRKYTVPLLKGTAKRAARLLSRSKIYWKFGRELTVIPIYCIQKPDSQASNIYTEFNGANYKWRLHASTADNFAHKTLTAKYKEMVAAIESVWLDRRAMVPQKSMWEERMITELTIPEGNGGLLWHQNSHYKEEGAGRDEVDSIAGISTVINTLFDVAERKAEDTDDSQNYYFQIIGDALPIEDFRLFYGRMALYIGGEAIALKSTLRPYGFFCFGIKKTEHREELDETVISHEGMGTTYAINFWRRDGSPATGTGVSVTNKLDTQNRGARFGERDKDPYKKLEHWEHDIKHLDLDLVRQEVADYFTNDAESMIASSAPPAKEDGKKKSKEEEAKEKKEDNKKKAAEEKKEKDEKKKKKKDEDAKKKKAKNSKIASSAPVSNANNRIMDNNDDGMV